MQPTTATYYFSHPFGDMCPPFLQMPSPSSYWLRKARMCRIWRGHELIKGHEHPNSPLSSKQMRNAWKYPVITQGSRDLSWTNTLVSFMVLVCIRDRLHLFPKPWSSVVLIVVRGDIKASSGPMVMTKQITSWILFIYPFIYLASERLDSMVWKVFSNQNDSVTLWFHIWSENHLNSLSCRIALDQNAFGLF